MVIPTFSSHDLVKVLRSLPIQWENARNVVIHSSLSSFGVLNQDRRDFFSHFISIFPKQANLFFPTFSYSYRRNLIFNQSNYHSSVYKDMGALSKMACESQFGNQSNCPLFSYYIIGPDADQLSRLVSVECFGDQSLFSTFFQENSYLLGLGITYSTGITPFVYIERSANVPFRFNLSLSGYRVNPISGNCESDTVIHFARDELSFPELVSNSREAIGFEMENRGISHVGVLNSSKLFCIDSSNFYAFVKSALLADPFCMCL